MLLLGLVATVFAAEPSALSQEQDKLVARYRRSPSSATQRALLDAAEAEGKACETLKDTPTASLVPCEAARALMEAATGPTDVALLPHLERLGEAYYARGQYKPSEEVWRLVLTLSEGFHGPSSVATATAADALGISLASQGLYDKAEPHYLRAIEIGTAELGPDHPAVGDFVSDLGMLRLQQGNYPKAEKWFREALRIVEGALGPEDAEVSRHLNNLSVALSRLAKYDEAIELNVRSVALTEATQGESRALASQLSNLAILHVRAERLDEAVQTFERVIPISEASFGPKHPITATHITNRGVVLSKLGRFSESEEQLLKGLAIRKEILGHDHPQVADSLGSLAELHRQRGDLEEARALTEEALVLVENRLGPEHPQVGLLSNNLGAALEDLGRHAEAEEAYRRGLSVWEAAYGSNHPNVATALSNLANVLADTGHREDAIELLKRALAIDEAARGPAHPSTGLRIANLAATFAEGEPLEDAGPYFERALAVFEAAYGPEHEEVGTLLSNWATWLDDLDRTDEALPLHRRALAITTNARGADHPGRAIRLNNLATSLINAGKEAEAIATYEQAIELLETRYGPDFPLLVSLLDGLAHVQHKQGDTRRSHELLEHALRIEDALFRTDLMTGTQAQRWSRLKAGQRRVDLAVRIAVEGGRHQAEVGFAAVLNRKARTQDLQHDILRLIRDQADQKGLELVDQLVWATRTLSSRLTFALQPDTQAIADLQSHIQDLERELASRSVRYRDTSSPVTAKDVARTLPRRSALVEFVVYGHLDATDTPHLEVAAFVLRPSGKVTVKRLGSLEDIETEAAALRQALRSRGSVAPVAQALADRVLAPLGVRNVEQLFVAPDGPLSVVPFELLVEDDRSPPVVTYLASGRERVASFPLESAESKPLVVYDVAYGQSDPDADANDPRPFFGTLPGTRPEGEAVASMLKPAIALVGGEATEAAVLAVERPSVVHIASHGYFFAPAFQGKAATSPDVPLVRSAVVLANANRGRRGLEDGLLTAAEVAHWDLRGTSLVTLSACQTALGDVLDGDGVHGLRRALKLAGARAFVLSLWDVDDESTSALMTAMYKALRSGMSAASALAEAKAQVRSQPKWAHPYYWAGFTISGDGSVTL